MDASGYVALTRQSGLLREIRLIANNVANMSTTGFKAEGLVFSEHVETTGGTSESVSMATANARHVVMAAGQMTQTGATFDLAIEGDGFFLVQGANGAELTRAGHFTLDRSGTLVTPDGHAVLDLGESPISLPPGGDAYHVAADGTISRDGQLIGQIGVVTPTDAAGLRRAGNTRFTAPKGWQPAENSRVMQGFLESSNVNAIEQISRLIEVQRAYELGRSLIDKEHDRIEAVVNTLGRST